MTRIAYVCADPGIPVYGCKGASIHVQEVIRALRRRGGDVTLFAARCGGEAPTDLADLPLVLTEPAPRGDGSAASRAREALACNRRLHDALVAGGPFDLVYERYSLWSVAGIGYAAGIEACPGLLEVNSPLIEEQATWRDLPFPEAARRVARFVIGQADRLIAVSPGVASWLEGFPGEAGRIEVIANGVDPARFEAVARARAARADHAHACPTIGFVGTLKPWHGLPVLIEAWARLRRSGVDARLLIVGDGPERERIAADLAARGLATAAELTGAVSPARIPALLGRMDLAVAPYPAGDGFYFSPLKLYEYMAAALPVVCSRVGHLATVIHDGHDGLLVPAGEAAPLAAALASLLADPSRARRLGQAARARVLAAHSWDAVAGRILDLADAARPRTRARTTPNLPAIEAGDRS